MYFGSGKRVPDPLMSNWMHIGNNCACPFSILIISCLSKYFPGFNSAGIGMSKLDPLYTFAISQFKPPRVPPRRPLSQILNHIGSVMFTPSQPISGQAARYASIGPVARLEITRQLHFISDHVHVQKSICPPQTCSV